MKKKNLKSFSEFVKETNSTDMDEMLRMSLKGGGDIGGTDASFAGSTFEDSDGCLKYCTGTFRDWDIDGD